MTYIITYSFTGKTGENLRVIALVIVAFCITNCSLFIPLSAGSDNQKKSARRADHGKYILNEEQEVGSRHLFAARGYKQCLNSSKAVSQFLSENIPDKNRDLFLIILLDENNDVINWEEICDITLTAPDIYTPEILEKVVASEASSVIFVQNQPTRSSALYKRDREILKDLQAALTSINVSLLDHLIISRNSCYSFADNRLL